MLFKTGDTESKTLDFALEVKELKEDGTFSGYGAVFGNKDSWDDVILKGAFLKTIREDAMPKFLWQHDRDEPIGVFTLLKEDDYGLWVEGKILINENIPNADKAYALLKHRAIDGLSIGYRATVWEWDDNQDIRFLKEIKLMEISLVTFPANDLARVATVKSLKDFRPEDITTEREYEKLLKSAGFSNSMAAYLAAGWQNPALRDVGGDGLKDAHDVAFESALDGFFKS